MKKIYTGIQHLSRLPRHLVALTTLSIFALMLLLPSSVLAASTQAQKCAPGDLQCVIAAGNQFIANRQASLTTLSGKVTTQLNDHHITSDQANVLQADVTTNQHGLSALKTKLDAETNVQAARQDVVNIFVQFRIYAVVLPRDYRRLYFDIEVNLDARLKSAEPRIQQAINHAPPSKQPQLNKLFNDYQAQLAVAEAQFDHAQADFPELTPSNYNYNRSSYLASLANLKAAEQTAHNALVRAANDLHQIVQIIKGSSTAASTATS
jgi:hypothetical protein